MTCSGVVLEEMIAKRDREIVCLREEVQRLQLTLQKVQESTANHISFLQQQLTNKIKDIETLEDKLHSQQDYERIKAELRILRERKLASSHPHHLSLSCSSSESTVDNQDDILSQSHPAEHSVDLGGVEIKRETETPADLLRTSSSVANTSSGLPGTSRTTPSPHPQSPSCFSPYDTLSIKSENDITDDPASFELDASIAYENDFENVSSIRTENGRLLEGIENQMDTAEITRQVKELLKKHNIGQRVFGKYVLGRLQGTISELLAHPKPWSRLTARGKEPFVRMIQFLSDEQNALVLRMIQDRLRGDVSPDTFHPEVSSDNAIKNILEQAKREMQSQIEDNNNSKIQQNQRRYNKTLYDDGEGKQSKDIINGILEQAKREMQLQQDPDVQHRQTSEIQVKLKMQESRNVDQLTQDHELLNAVSNTDFVQSIIKKVVSEISSEDTNFANTETPSLLNAWSTTKPTSLPQGSYHDSLSETNQNHSICRKQDNVFLLITRQSYKENLQPPQACDGSSCDESLTHPLPEQYNGRKQQQNHQFSYLDTLTISRKVKKVLLENNLGQRLFGDMVLGMTQGSVSDLLARPKPWSELSLKGKEPFIRMHVWLEDPQNVQQLKAIKSAGHTAHSKWPLTLLSSGSDGTSQRTLLDMNATASLLLDHPGAFKLAKRPRVVLTSREKEVLNRAYQLEPYPSHLTTQRLALQLGLETSTVTNWFYNHRSRSRLRQTVQDRRSATTQFNNSPQYDPELTSQDHFTDPEPVQDSHSMDMDTHLMTVKHEPDEVQISDVKMEEREVNETPEFISTGTQSGEKFKIIKIEYEEDMKPLSI